MFIEKSATPRCFKEAHLDALHVEYKFHSKAWMTSEIMTKEAGPKVATAEKRNFYSFG